MAIIGKLADFDELTLTAINDFLRHLKTKHGGQGSSDDQARRKPRIDNPALP